MKIVTQLIFIDAIQLLVFIIGVSAIHLKAVHVPRYVLQGQTISLDCRYDLQDSTLYSVKWYKDGLEIYRYVPKAERRIQIYPMEGVDIDVQSTKPGAIVIRDVTMSSSGRYGCEVSGESPYFHTRYKEKNLTVNVLPDETPEISGGLPNYEVGDILDVNCSSPLTRPAPRLMWLINDYPAKRQDILRYPNVETSRGMEKSVQGLRFVVRKEHFRFGRLEIKCAAVLGRRFHKTRHQQTRRNGFHRKDIITLQSQYYLDRSYNESSTLCQHLSIMFMIVAFSSLLRSC
ncbi:Uncharacterised protein g5583 [Pycnogonum litorale]